MTKLRFICLALSSALITGCGEGGARVQNLNSTSTPSPSVSPWDRNLLANGDAETITEGIKGTIEGWSKTADVLAMNYGGAPDEWQSGKPGPPDGRDRYFRLALAINEPTKEVTQTVNVVGAEAEIDAGTAECALGGWFGGWAGGDGSAQLRVSFQGANGAELGTLATEPPDPAKLTKPEMGRATMTKITAVGMVPPGTRRMEVHLAAVRPTQKVDTNAVATADSLSLVLRKTR
ncbi:MAG TPA: hypothetical protein VFG14_17055 [Chthoniobacteraceae bacterium]|jgi:hypothetical protein|nr:hypothetical protein [Chthoniobacteraceae bacterium]